ncbi:MAG: hypothetical protein ABJA37_01650 [Ferruginibacter sp.]
MIRKFSWIFLIAGTLIMICVMSFSGKPLKNAATPYGIINLELANSAIKVQNILNAWDNDISKNTDVIAAAKKNTWLDFIFIIFYTSLFYFLCKKLVSFFLKNSGWKHAGNIVSTGAIIAGLLDVGENTGMLKSLNGNVSDNIALFTACCAAIKWMLVFITIIFLIAGFTYRIFILKTKPGYRDEQN